MLKEIRLTQWVIIPTIFFVLGILGAIYFQREISQAQQQFPPPPADIPLAADKGYGVTVDLTQYTEVELHQQLDTMQRAGLTWLRQPLHWAELEPERGYFNWEPYDRAIGAAHLRGFKIIAVLDTSPIWARAANTPLTTPPREVTDFGQFARTVALHYAPEIEYYQIWHEPNLSEHWGGRYVNAAEYVLLLKNASLNIRAVQPQAKIVAASLAPTTETGPLNLNEPAYLEAMYQAKAAPWFDVMAGQLYGFDLPVRPVQIDPQLLNIHRINLLRQVMITYDDAHKPLWATAFGWNALPADWSGRSSIWFSDVPAKQMICTAEALDFARLNWPWLGPILAIRWDDTGLDEDDPARGFAIYPTLLAPFETAGKTKVYTATVGNYPATHLSGKYSSGWGYAQDTVDIPGPTETKAEPPTLTIPFEGTRLDLKINRGPYVGYLWVSIDGQPSQALPQDETGRSYVVLYDPLRESDTVALARYLSDGDHLAVIEAEGGWGQWAISGWQVYREADTRVQTLWLAASLVVAAISGGVLLWQGGRQRQYVWPGILYLWSHLNALYNRLNNYQQIGLTFGLVLAFYFLPGPLALAILPLLLLTFLLRLETGLMVLSFGISFFLAKKSLPGGTFSILELGLALLVLATAIRLLLPRLNANLQLEERLPWPELASLSWLNLSDWAALALVILATATTFTANNRGVALYELRTVVVEAVVFYFLIRLIPRLEQIERASFAQWLIDAFVAGATLHAGAALYQYFLAPAQTITAEGVHRAIGYFYGSPNNLSLFLDRAFPILAAVAFFGLRGKRRVLYGLGLIIVSATLFLTYSKGSLLLAIPAVLLFLALLKGGKAVWLGAGSGLILLAVALIPISRTERFQNTFSLQPGSTAFFRLKLWQSAWQMLKERPLTGLGLDNFLYQYRTRYISPQAWAEPDLSHPHNHILDFGTRLGGGGIVLLVWLQGAFWSRALKGYFQSANANTQSQILLLGLMGGMITFLVHGLVDNAFFLVDLAFTFFLSLGIVEEINK
jgi:O-antigen ligase